MMMVTRKTSMEIRWEREAAIHTQKCALPMMSCRSYDVHEEEYCGMHINMGFISTDSVADA